MLRAILTLFLFIGAALPVLAEKRVALVIGNSDYRNATPLKNPANDAEDISKALEQLGFDVVVGRDLDAVGMRRTVKRFADKLTGADVSLFFYAGHALQVRGENFLAPVDADLKKESDLDFETVSLDLVRRQMERETTTQLVFLDACRDNPLARSFASRTRSSGEGLGLARLETSAEGTFIAFATQPDNVALDGDGRNSPFTTALLRNIHRPNVEISALMTDVRREVYEKTNQQQLPWTNSSLLGAFYFKQEEVRRQLSEADAQRTEELEKLAAQAEAFEAISNSNDAAELERFLKTHPGSIYEPLVRQALERLAAASVKTARLEQPVAERGAGVKAEVETQGRAGSAVRAPDAEDASSRPESATVSREAVRSIQEQLVRVGCTPGRPDGIWGRNSRRALEEFARHGKVDLASLEPSSELLETLKARTGRICPQTVVAPPAEQKREVVRTPPNRTATASPPKARPQAKAPPARKPSGNACFRFNGQLICD